MVRRSTTMFFQAISNALTQCPKSYLLAQLEEQKRCLCRRPLCNCSSPSSTLLCNISLLSGWWSILCYFYAGDSRCAQKNRKYTFSKSLKWNIVVQTHVALSYPQTLVLSALAAGWLSPRKSSIDLQEAFPSFSDIIITKVSFIGVKLRVHACDDQTDEQILKIL